MALFNKVTVLVINLVKELLYVSVGNRRGIRLEGRHSDVSFAHHAFTSSSIFSLKGKIMQNFEDVEDHDGMLASKFSKQMS